MEMQQRTAFDIGIAAMMSGWGQGNNGLLPRPLEGRLPQGGSAPVGSFLHTHTHVYGPSHGVLP